MVQVKGFVFNGMKVNSYVLWNEAGDCVLIDIGCNSSAERESFLGFMRGNGLIPGALLLTHGHFDHIMGAQFVCDTYPVESWIHSEDRQNVADSVSLSGIYGLSMEDPQFVPGRLLRDGDEIIQGSLRLRVLHTPGHTPGSVCFYEPRERILFSGDTLIRGSLGFSNDGYRNLLLCLKEKILPLPRDMRIFCGHGDPTTLEEEMQCNPFFRLLTKENFH